MTASESPGENRGQRMTVVVPHLNDWAGLERCLTSLEHQSLARPMFDIIVVDNGSADFEARRPDLLSRYPAISALQEQEPGPGLARNMGIIAAKTAMIACIDSDCTADTHWLETARDALVSRGEGTIIGGDVRISFADPKRPNSIEAFEAIFSFRQDDFINRQKFSVTANLALWKRDFERVGPFGGITVAEDREWGIKAAAMNLPTIYLPQMIVFHPARESMEALKNKWARHVAHSMTEVRAKPAGSIRWAIRTAVVGLSWIPHLGLVWTSDRLPDTRARFLASRTLADVRLFRAKEMIRQAGARESGASRWNR